MIRYNSEWKSNQVIEIKMSVEGIGDVGFLKLLRLLPGINYEPGKMFSDPEGAVAYKVLSDFMGYDPDVMVVWSSRIELPENRGKGYGVKLYTEAARIAAIENRVMVPNVYYAGIDTSDEALRVWNSKRFAERVSLFKKIAIFRNRQ